MIGRFVTRVRNLERAQPSPGDQDAFRARVERARQRVVDMMTDEEWEASQTPKMLGVTEAEAAGATEIAGTARRRGRKPMIADMLRTSRA